MQLFIEALLLDIGERYPFRADFIANLRALANPEKVRQIIRVRLYAGFVPLDRNRCLMQTTWTKVRVFVHPQNLFS